MSDKDTHTDEITQNFSNLSVSERDTHPDGITQDTVGEVSSIHDDDDLIEIQVVDDAGASITTTDGTLVQGSGDSTSAGDGLSQGPVLHTIFWAFRKDDPERPFITCKATLDGTLQSLADTAGANAAFSTNRVVEWFVDGKITRGRTWLKLTLKKSDGSLTNIFGGMTEKKWQARLDKACKKAKEKFGDNVHVTKLSEDEFTAEFWPEWGEPRRTIAIRNGAGEVISEIPYIPGYGQ